MKILSLSLIAVSITLIVFVNRSTHQVNTLQNELEEIKEANETCVILNGYLEARLAKGISREAESIIGDIGRRLTIAEEDNQKLMNELSDCNREHRKEYDRLKTKFEQ
jgi:hypothetical protein